MRSQSHFKEAPMQHHYFGELDTDDIEGRDVIWEDERQLNAQTFEICLWADAGQQLDTLQLDAFAALLQDLPALDAQARSHLLAELQTDDEFMRHHLEEVENFPRLAELAPDGDMAAPDFVRAMVLVNIGLWADEPASVVMDYQIDPEHSDQILAVKLTAQGELTAVHWES